MHLLLCFLERAMAYSATTVLPAEVWAHTRIDSRFSILRTALFWKSSSSKW